MTKEGLEKANKKLEDRIELLKEKLRENIVHDDIGKIHKSDVVVLDRFIFSSISYTLAKLCLDLEEGQTKAMVSEILSVLGKIESEYNRRAKREESIHNRNRRPVI